MRPLWTEVGHQEADSQPGTSGGPSLRFLPPLLKAFLHFASKSNMCS